MELLKRNRDEMNMELQSTITKQKIQGKTDKIINKSENRMPGQKDTEKD